MAETGLKDRIEPFLKRLPAVKRPEKHVHFRRKLTWTVAVLVLYFVLSNIAVFGLSKNSQDLFQAYRSILAGSSGSIILLGISPIVTASIVLQLLVGAEILPLDTTDPKDQGIFQGLQKLLVFVMIILETLPQMYGGLLIPDTTMAASLFHGSTGILSLLIFIQIALGGVIILYMDEIVSKWGIGSGVSLFIVAGVAQGLISGVFNWNPPYLNYPIGFDVAGLGQDNLPVGIIFNWYYMFTHLSSSQLISLSGLEILLTKGDLLALIATIVVFLMVVYVESVRIEIPLSHAAVRGARGKFPVKLIYASVLPMILVRALQANVQLVGELLYGRGISWFGQYSNGVAQPPGLMFFVKPLNGWQDWLPPFVGSYYPGIQTWMVVLHVCTDAFILIAGGIVFAIFWVETTGMGSTRVAKQIQKSGMQIPGFRRNEQVIEKVVSRYIPKVTVIGGAFIGVLTLIASMFGILGNGSGTGMLLAVSIIYQLYEKVASEQLMEMHPLIRRFLGEE
jgi:preprotein translocase subunit SecY